MNGNLLTTAVMACIDKSVVLKNNFGDSWARSEEGVVFAFCGIGLGNLFILPLPVKALHSVKEKVVL